MKTTLSIFSRASLLFLLTPSFNSFADITTPNQLVAAVLEANPQIEIAQATWQASLAKIKQLGSLDDPQFQYSFAPFTIDHSTSSFGQRIEVSQKIPFPGKLAARSKVAELQAESQLQNITYVQLLLASRAKRLFADWYFIHQAIALNRTNHTVLTGFRDIAMNRYSTGQTSKHSVLQIEGDQAEIKHRLIELQHQQKQVLVQLNTLLNRPVDTAVSIPQRLPEIKSLPSLKQLQIFTIKSHPKLKAVAANIQKHKVQTDLAKMAYYPDFKISAGYNSLWNDENKRFNMGVGINIPLDQSKRQAVEQETKARSQKAHWNKIDLLALIKEKLTLAYTNVEESFHVLRLYRETLLPLADETLALAKTEYQAGKGDFLALITNKQNRIQAQLKTEQAIADLHHHLAELELATGSLEALSIIKAQGEK